MFILERMIPWDIENWYWEPIPDASFDTVPEALAYLTLATTCQVHARFRLRTESGHEVLHMVTVSEALRAATPPQSLTQLPDSATMEAAR